MKRTIGLIVLMLVMGSQPVWAARTQIHDAAESPQYGRKFGGMIGRGALNAATCFVDVIVNVVNETKTGPPFVGTLTGVAKGAGCGVLRLGSGAVDLVTFWVPGFNGFPVSDSYENCLAPSAAPMSMESPLPAGYGEPATSIAAPDTTMPAPQEAPAPAEPKRQWTK